MTTSVIIENRNGNTQAIEVLEYDGKAQPQPVIILQPGNGVVLQVWQGRDLHIREVPSGS